MNRTFLEVNIGGVESVKRGVPLHTFSPVSVVQTPCCTTPKSPSPRVLLRAMASTGMSCLPGGRTTVEMGREMRCSGGEGLSDLPDGSFPPVLMMACQQKRVYQCYWCTYVFLLS